MKVTAFSFLVSLHRLFFALATIGFFVWIANQHYPIQGSTALHYTGGTLHGLISRPHPLDRVRIEKQDGDTFERFIEDPVYFEVKTSLPYDSAYFRVAYKNRTRGPLSLGLKESPSGKVIFLERIKEVGQDKDWSVGEVSLPLSAVERVKDRYSFVFSFPGVQYEYPERGDILLYRMDISLQREPLSWADAKAFIKSRFSL